MRWLLLLLALCFATYSLGVPEKKADDGKKGVTKDERGTSKTPLFVNVITPEKTVDQINRENEERAEKRAVDKQTINLTEEIKTFTGYLVLIGAIQAGIFFLQLIVFGRQARRLRETVESQERSERAILFATKIEPAIFPTAAHDKIYPGGQDAPWPRIHYSFVNFGRSAAVIKRVRMHLILKETLPSEPDYQDAVSQEGENVLANGDITHPNRIVFGRHLTADELIEVRNGLKKFFMFGHVRYTDIYGSLHCYAFCFQFLPERNSVFVTGGPNYNYRRVEKNKEETVAS